jgi:hypothetical protein
MLWTSLLFDCFLYYLGLLLYYSGVCVVFVRIFAMFVFMSVCSIYTQSDTNGCKILLCKVCIEHFCTDAHGSIPCNSCSHRCWSPNLYRVVVLLMVCSGLTGT